MVRWYNWRATARWLMIRRLLSRQMWRRGWDLNPRWTNAHSGFQDRPIQPLSHPSILQVEAAELNLFNLSLNLSLPL